MTDINPLAKEWEKHGLVLREYQKEGVEMMDSWYQAGHGGINGDEMGLGKTCQAIVQILRMKEDGKGPFLVVSPLSVCDHWSSEVERFSCGTLNPVGYHGYEAARAELLKQLGKLQKNTVFIVPFHIFRGDAELIAKFQEKSKLRFDVIIVDEAHNIKNSECQLAETLKPYRRKAWFLLMTGTPIQNHLGELYSLLTFVDPDQFKDAIKARSAFIERYKDNTNLPGLRKILSQYLIRRTKDLVCKELPSCEQVILYHNITEIQKRLYLDIIARDYEDLLMNTKQKHQSLNNIHMQLRKCVLHPYLFKGVEPEPFVEGEHMVEASGKFLVLDRLLRYLKEKKHKCLIFSQFVIVLDILQDFMNLRGYNYERFDGSVRAEERFAAINNFQQTTSKTKKGLREAEKDEPWCFLLTTRAGGVGLNLNAADTVIFMDADWNPQNDIQAMARCHRIGQNKPVRVIRLIARYTVEQHMHARIRDKLKFTDKVMGNEEVKITAFDMLGMIKQSLGTLKEQKHEKYELTDKDLESVIGETNADGEWLPMKNDKENQVPAALRLDPDDVDKRDTDYNDYRVYEGRHYRISAKDEAAFEELRLLRLAGTKRNGRRRSYVEGDGEGKDESVRADDVMKRMERAHEISEKRKIAAQAKKDALWTANGYVSGNLPLPAADDQQSLVSSGVEEAIPLYYVHGDVTKPQREEGDHSKCQLILHCVDNSGTFGSRGIFAALRAKDPSIADRYELISHMGDMKMGDAHLINDVKDMRGPPGDEQQPSTSADVSEAVVLFVAQSSKHRDEIRPTILEQCFTRIGEYARHCDASVHMARIGYGTSLSWYTVERLIKKCISDHGVPTYIYYFARQHRPQPPSPPPQSPRAPTKRPKPALRGPSKRPKVEKTSGDFVVDDEDEEEDEESSSSSASSSASENDWSEDDGEEEEEEDTSDEGSSADEEIDDEELEELKIRRRSRRQPLRDVRSRYSDRKRMISNNSNSESSEEANVSESDTEGYHTPQHLPPFTDMAVSLYGMDKNVAEKLTDIIVENEGYVITDKSELKDATHAVVDPETAGDSEKFEEFKKLFDVDCVFVEENWISDCVEARKKLDALLNEP